jgi:hypothetical protein
MQMQKDTFNIRQLTLFTLLIGQMLFSCKNVSQPQSDQELVFKTDCYDTSIVWVYPDLERNDTLFRLDSYPGTGKRKAKNGHWIIYYDKAFTKKAYEVSVENGKEIGTFTSWRRNGTKKYEGSCIGDIKYGYYREWYPNNVLKAEKYMRNDTVIGTSKRYYITGELEDETFYNQKRISKTLKYDKAGNVICMTYYKPTGPHYFQTDEYLEVNLNSYGEITKAFKYFTDTTEENNSEMGHFFVVSSTKINLDSLKK